MEERDINWYVVFVMGGRELTLIDYVNRNEMIHAFSPQVEQIHRKQGKSFIIKKPMFPSYIFIKTAFDKIEFREYLKQKRYEKSGIIKELRYDNEISSLSDEEINWLEHLLNQEAVLQTSIGIMNGDRIIVTDGPLQGYESYIIHIDRHKRKATLAFQMLGKEVKLDTTLEIVKKIE